MKTTEVTLVNELVQVSCTTQHHAIGMLHCVCHRSILDHRMPALGLILQVFYLHGDLTWCCVARIPSRKQRSWSR